jgi:hypothetical protein
MKEKLGRAKPEDLVFHERTMAKYAKSLGVPG